MQSAHFVRQALTAYKENLSLGGLYQVRTQPALRWHERGSAGAFMFAVPDCLTASRAS